MWEKINKSLQKNILKIHHENILEAEHIFYKNIISFK